MAQADEERWSQLFSSLDKLTHSHNDLRDDIKVSNQRVELLTTKYIDIDTRMSKAEKFLSLLERENRAKNIVLFKLEDSITINKKLFDNILDIFKKVDLIIPEWAIVDVFRMGKTEGSRPVLIKFVSTKWVRNVFDRVKELKSLNYIIVNDRSKQEREIRRELLDKVRLLKESGQNAFLKGNKIFVDDTEISQDNFNPVLSQNNVSAIASANLISKNQNAVSVSPSTISKENKKKRGRKDKSMKMDSKRQRPLDGYLDKQAPGISGTQRQDSESGNLESDFSEE